MCEFDEELDDKVCILTSDYELIEIDGIVLPYSQGTQSGIIPLITVDQVRKESVEFYEREAIRRLQRL